MEKVIFDHNPAAMLISAVIFDHYQRAGLYKNHISTPNDSFLSVLEWLGNYIRDNEPFASMTQNSSYSLSNNIIVEFHTYKVLFLYENTAIASH